MIPNIGRVSIVMPAFNEAEHIYKNLMIASSDFDKFLSDYEIILVDDGSGDGTKLEAQRAADSNERIKVVSYDNNAGKGNAIKVGVKESSGKYIVLLDSDLDLSAAQVEGFLQKLISEKADVVIGSKLHKKSIVEYPLSRKIVSLCYYIFLLILFRLNVKDTQTGLKVYKSDVIKPIMEIIKTDGYAYDIELLAVSSRFKCKITEMPVILKFQRAQGFGRIKFKDIINVFKDTMAIFYRLRILKYYDSIRDVKNLERKKKMNPST